MAANAFARSMIMLPRLRVLQYPCSPKTIHSTAILLKKRGETATIDDLFADDAFVENGLVKDSSLLFSAKSSTIPGQPSEQMPKNEEIKGRKRRVLPHAVKLERFNNLLSFMDPRIGKRLTIQRPLMRRRSWLTLLDVTADKDQMQKVVDLFPNARGEFPESYALAFTRRCHELSCPELALTVFGDFAKYNLPLTLAAGRWLIHSLYVQHPISKTFLATSYFPAYNLPQISEDLPTAVMVAVACYNHKNKTSETIKVADALLPHIRRMWAEEQTTLASATTLEEARVKKWVAWGLKRLNRAVSREKDEFVVPPEIVPSRIKIDGPSTIPHSNVQLNKTIH